MNWSLKVEDVRHGMAYAEFTGAQTFGGIPCTGEHADLLPDRPCLYCGAWL